MTLQCPVCHGPIDPLKIYVDLESSTISFGGKTAQVTPHQAKILDFLKDGRLKTYDRILFYLYEGDNEPEGAMETLRVHAARIRPILRRIGVYLVASWGKGFRLTHEEPLK